MDTPSPRRTDHTPLTTSTDIGDISSNHSHATIPTVTRAATVPEDTHHTPHPATAAVHTTFWLMDAPSPLTP